MDSSRYKSKEDLEAKIDWEGGLTEVIFDYGIHATELPVDTPAEVVRAWEAVEACRDALRTIYGWLYS